MSTVPLCSDYTVESGAACSSCPPLGTARFLAPLITRSCPLKDRAVSLIDLLLGRPLANSEERAEKIGPLQGIPIFGLDALGSAAYGPEAALTLLIPLGLLGVQYTPRITLAIIIL